MKELNSWLLVVLLLAGCNKEKFFDGPNYVADDFEAVLHVDSLISPHTGNWNYLQLTRDENTITIDTTNPHTGNQCLKFYAQPSVDGASKSDVAAQHLAFWEGDVVRFTGWFYLPDEGSPNYLYLFDIEENSVIGAGPGIRIALQGEEGYLQVQRGKYLEPTIHQSDPKVAFPRNQWVELVVEIDLDRKKKGYIKMWQDGQLLIDAHDIQTLPKEELYFIQGTKGLYDNVQVGITANSPDSEITLYVDDVVIEKVN